MLKRKRIRVSQPWRPSKEGPADIYGSVRLISLVNICSGTEGKKTVSLERLRKAKRPLGPGWGPGPAWPWARLGLDCSSARLWARPGLGPWPLSGLCLASVWALSGLRLVSAWPLSGLCPIFHPPVQRNSGLKNAILITNRPPRYRGKKMLLGPEPGCPA